jgi:hypothetical protein
MARAGWWAIETGQVGRSCARWSMLLSVAWTPQRRERGRGQACLTAEMSSDTLILSADERAAAERLVELHVEVAALEHTHLQSDPLVAHRSTSVPWTTDLSIRDIRRLVAPRGNALRRLPAARILGTRRAARQLGRCAHG